MKTGYDSVAMTAAEWRSVVPAKNPEVIGCYGNGLYANHTAASEAFPRALIFTYDVHATMPSCDALDIEAGDASAGDAPGWCRAWAKTAGHVLSLPMPYTFASNVSSVITALLDAGFKREQFLIHSAHFGTWRHICGPSTCGYPQADGTQWANHGPNHENVDQNVFYDHVFGSQLPPKPDAHYDWFDNSRRLLFAGRTERQIVEEYDKWRATQSTKHHPHRARLGVLRVLLLAGSMRLTRLTTSDTQHKFHRFWRKRELLDRSRGHRFV